MNPQLEYYRAFGQPAQGTLTFTAQLEAGDAPEVGGVSYIAGTDFQIGDNLFHTAQNFAGVVNSDRTKYSSTHAMVAPVRPVYAMYYGNIVAIVATAPGTDGNVISITGVAGKVTASAATLLGGTAAPTLTTATVAAAYTASTTVTWNDYVRTATGSAITLAPVSVFHRQAILHAPPANVAAVAFGPNANCRMSVLPGGYYNIPPVEGAVFNAGTGWYMNGTAGDTLVVLYVQ